jgi:hypothetical protein
MAAKGDVVRRRSQCWDAELTMVVMCGRRGRIERSRGWVKSSRLWAERGVVCGAKKLVGRRCQPLGWDDRRMPMPARGVCLLPQQRAMSQQQHGRATGRSVHVRSLMNKTRALSFSSFSQHHS